MEIDLGNYHKINSAATGQNSRHLLLVPILLLATLLGSLPAFTTKSVMGDERDHFKYGALIYSGDSDRFDDSKMPFSAFNVVAYKVMNRLLPETAGNELGRIRMGRAATVLFTALTSIIVYFWGRQLYGSAAGLAAMFMFVIEPNLMAHGRLVTTDMYATGMMTMALYSFWHFLRQPGWKWGIVSSAVLGISQLAKYTNIVLFPIFIILALGYYLPELGTLGKLPRGRRRRLLLRVLLIGAGFLVVSLLIINAGFLFNQSMTILEDYVFKSDLMKTLQELPVLAKIPVPVPYPYLEGIDLIHYRERTNTGFGGSYLFGEIRHAQGFPGYFLIASVFKIPIALQILFLAALVGYFIKGNKGSFWKKEWFLLLPLFILGVYLNFFFRAQIGLRFALVTFPLMILFSARLFKNWSVVDRKIRLAAYLLLLYMFISMISYYPHVLSYFNEFLPDRKMAYRILVDSNLDWGQNSYYLEEYKTMHPEAIINPEEPVSGIVIINANKLTGIMAGPEKYAWLRENFKPDGHIAYSYLVFQLSDEDISLISEAP